MVTRLRVARIYFTRASPAGDAPPSPEKSITMSAIPTTFRSLSRQLRRNPWFLAVAVITLGVGIGATTSIFAVVDAVLIRPLPYAEADRLVALKHDSPGLGTDQLEMSDGTYVLYRKENRVLADLGIYRSEAATLTGAGTPERLQSAEVTGSIFQVLRVRPALGRMIQEADEKPGAEKVAVLSDGLWRRRFGGDPGILGKTLRADGVERRIVGVMPRDFAFPATDTAAWLPLTIDPAHYRIGDFSYHGLGRLRPGVSSERAARELSALVWRIPEVYGDQGLPREMIQSARFSVHVTPLRDTIVGDVESLLWILLGSVACILLIACANVANLFLVRAEGRSREMAVRTALGASRGDIARLFLVESLALSLLGGVLGLVLTAAGVRLLVDLRPPGIPRLSEIGVDGRVLLFTLLLSGFAGLFCGAVAALRYGSPAAAPTLGDGGRGGTAGRGRLRARNVLVAVQVALALMLLIGSGLMLRSFWQLRGVDPGFDPRGVLTLRLDLPTADYRDAPAVYRFTDQLLERVRALPGVAGVASVDSLPLGGSDNSTGYTFEDFPRPPGQVLSMISDGFVSPGYFQALGIPVIAGRAFTRQDVDPGAKPVLISHALAARLWPGRSPIGRRLAAGSSDAPEWRTIVGVVGDVHVQGIADKPEQRVYYPMLRATGKDGIFIPHGFSLVIKSQGDPTRLAGPVREVVRSLDPNLPLSDVRSMRELETRSIVRTTFTMLLLAIAAAVALLLGAVGIYGVISYVVGQRTREIGVRMALGARREEISRMVLREGLGIILAGVAVGLAGALAATRLMASLLYGVSPTDPWTFAVVPVLLVAVALLASWIPAQRASAVEPLEAIRHE
jgi:putative ABC transport system permease protein